MVGYYTSGLQYPATLEGAGNLKSLVCTLGQVTPPGISESCSLAGRSGVTRATELVLRPPMARVRPPRSGSSSTRADVQIPHTEKLPVVELKFIIQ